MRTSKSAASRAAGCRAIRPSLLAFRVRVHATDRRPRAPRDDRPARTLRLGTPSWDDEVRMRRLRRNAGEACEKTCSPLDGRIQVTVVTAPARVRASRPGLHILQGTGRGDLRTGTVCDRA